MYMALKHHFDPSSSYDFFKYEGRLRWLTPQKYELRPDKWFCHGLSKLYPDNATCLFFLASNFFEGNTTWVRDLLSEESKIIFQDKLKIKESLEYEVTQDLNIALAGPDGTLTTQALKDALRVVKGRHPTLLTGALQGSIRKETLIVLNSLIGFLPVWEKKISDTILFPPFKHKCVSYEPFLCIDKKKFQQSFRMRLTNT